MRSWWRLGLVGAAAYVVFLVSSVPVATLLPYLQPHLPGIRLAGVSGTLWSGEALHASAGSVQLDDLHWSLRPLALFTGALGFSIDARLAGKPLTAHAGLGVFSGAYVSDVAGRVAAADLLYWAGLTHMKLDGELDFNIDDVDGIGAGVPAVAGTVSWAPARVLAPLDLNLGKARLQTRIDAGVTRGELVAEGGVLTATGDVTVNPDGSYQLVGEVQKKGAVPQAVDRFLATFAEYKNGNYRLEWSDTIKF